MTVEARDRFEIGALALDGHSEESLRCPLSEQGGHAVGSRETRMHRRVASALFSVMLLAAPLRPGLPSQLVGQASAGELDQVAPAERTQPPPATPSKGAASVASICDALAAAAGENDLPVDFFARLIWQESRFDPTAVSRAGAQGVAQFMPATATSRGLADPFDPIEAIAHSAKLLRDLRRDFGNLGLAAAAYNAGPRRVRDWLAGRRGLPRETDAYVRIVTGQSPQQWARGQAGPPPKHLLHPVARPPNPAL